ncbi:hypothetical protein [Neptunicella sp. SCSIO 80796]|uniref:hypothetical protein n=1 Tax=Neptunicella plasticusilytica TaxID=3117012 RepID=UPI003A4E5656
MRAKTIAVAALGLLSVNLWASNVNATELPKILTDKAVQQTNYLPDYSYAGYANGERQPDISEYRVIDVEQHHINANDGKDDSLALLALLDELNNQTRPVVLQFAAGRYILSEIIYIQRSNIVLRGSGSGEGGTEFYFPRPLNYVKPPAELAELREYLLSLNKIQKEKTNNIALPFSQWSWSGGFFWSKVDGQRVKQYLSAYEQPSQLLAQAINGKQGEFSLTVNDASRLQAGQVIEISWYNPEGEQGSFLNELYGEEKIKIGSHHWQQPELALARQQVLITDVRGQRIQIKAPLLHNIRPQWHVSLSEWQHLQQVGFEHFKIAFPYAENIAHHVEQGFNGLYLTRLFNSWVDDVQINNADSGILTEEIASVTISNVTTGGDKLAHYSVQMGGVHNVLVDHLQVNNRVRHPLSFNTFSTRSVYANSAVAEQPLLDQHSGINQQNLFDNIQVRITLPAKGDKHYALFKGGGAGYWKPSHAAYNSFWNIRAEFTNRFEDNQPVLLDGMQDGPFARLMGISANQPVKVEYGPTAYMEGINHYYQDVPSLYQYQLNQRIKAH